MGAGALGASSNLVVAALGELLLQPTPLALRIC
jgi:hypothetical protein